MPTGTSAASEAATQGTAEDERIFNTTVCIIVEMCHRIVTNTYANEYFWRFGL